MPSTAVAILTALIRYYVIYIYIYQVHTSYSGGGHLDPNVAILTRRATIKAAINMAIKVATYDSVST